MSGYVKNALDASATIITEMMTSPQATATKRPKVVSTPIRVTHVVFDFDGGGLESLVATMASHFAGSAVQTSLVTLGGRVGRLGAASRHQFDVFEVVKSVPALSMIRPRAAARAIRRTRADVVHLHTGAWYKGVYAARLAGVNRVVYTEHGREHYDPPLMRWIDGRAARKTDAVIAVSDRLGKYLSRVVGVAPEKIHTIHNGVDTTRFTPGCAPRDFRASLNIPQDSIVIGSVGRLEAVKSYEILLDAAALLRKSWRQPFHIVVFGDGRQREALLARAARLGISDIVRLPGWCDEPLKAHRLIDVFVLSSQSEGQSVSLLEAMACGSAPVVSNVGANAEMLGPAFRSHVVPPNRPRLLADALGALSSREKIRGVGLAMRDRVVDHYSVDRMMTGYETLYRRLIAESVNQ